MPSASRVVLTCLLGAGVGLGLMACSPAESPAPLPPPADLTAPPAAAPLTASAEIAALTDVEIAGEVRFIESGDYVRIEAEIRGLDDGLYGFHIHTGTDCDDRGGHYDPTGMPHGSPDEPTELRHVGDLGNLVSRDGIARFVRIDPVVALDGDHSVIGRIAVIHNDSDKLLPQPAGDSGTQIGCGVIHAGHGGRMTP